MQLLSALGAKVEDLTGAATDGVDDDVDLAELRDGLGDEPLALVFDGHVGGDREALGAGGLHPLDGVAKRVRGTPGDSDTSSGARQRFGHRGTDRAATARDDRHATIEAEDVELAHRPPHADPRRRRETRLSVNETPGGPTLAVGP